MAYEMYMRNILCPVTPSKLQLKIKNQNKTMNLINGDEVNILKKAGLTEISYDLLLPNVKYPFATYGAGRFVDADYFLKEFEEMKVSEKPFRWKLFRTMPNGRVLFDNNMLVTLEDYTIKEDAKEGFDVVVTIKLKQYRHHGTKIIKVSTPTDETEEAVASIEEVRETTNSPEPTEGETVTHTVVSGDSLWNIAKYYYGDGSKYTAIFEANKDKIQNPSLIYEGQVLTIPDAKNATAMSKKISETKKKTASQTQTQTQSNGSSDNAQSGSTSTVKVTVVNYGHVPPNQTFSIEYTANGKSNKLKNESGTKSYVVDVGSKVKVSFVPYLVDKVNVRNSGGSWTSTYFGGKYTYTCDNVNYDCKVLINWK